MRLHKTFLLITAALVLAAAMPLQAQNMPGKNPEKLHLEIMRRLDNLETQRTVTSEDITVLKEAVEQLSLSAKPASSEEDDSFFDRAPGAGLYSGLENLSGGKLRAALKELVSKHTSHDYQRAQDIIFEDLDNNGGYVECIYTGRKLKTKKEPDANNMNVEHSWPQSKGAKGIAKSDLHHLFASDSKANARRGNNPFGYVSHPIWEEGGSKFDGDVFDVRKERRGDIARALFYFALRYDMPISPNHEKVLKEWHKEDPVDARERARNDKIHNYQNNRNPFIDRPEFAEKIDF
ncbi:MAG: hypothetical protein GX221_07375 [Candidatus Riflebacteria bacterium]|mgnify:CR=1 FL=1|nr:hypothetical protein [Candidatus Riflebacteria bacterium]